MNVNWRTVLLGVRDGAWISGELGGARFLFTRGLALIYVIAFASWWVQLDGLIGSRGIAPAASFLAAVKEHFAAQSGMAWLEVPSLFLIHSGDAVLAAGCLLGIALALLALAGIAQGPCFGALWVLYLSQVSCGGVFMSFQWDTLLLEAGLLAIFCAPWRWLASLAAFLGTRFAM